MSTQMPFKCRSYALLLAALFLPALGLAQTETKLNNFGSSPVFLLTTPYTNGQCLVYSTSSIAWINSSCGGGGSGTVTSVGLSVPGSSLFGVSGSPVTTSGTLGLTTTGTSGGIPYFSSSSTLASSAALTANALLLGGGAGGTPTVVSGLGTTTQVLHGNAAGAPFFSALVAADLPSSPTLTNSLWTFNFTGQTANTDIDLGLFENTTAAAAAAQQNACIHLQGQGWKTTATAASQPIDIRICIQPVQGAAAPTANVVIESSIGGAAYANILAINSAGAVNGLNTSSPWLGTLQINGTGAAIANGVVSGGTNTVTIKANTLLNLSIAPTIVTSLVNVAVDVAGQGLQVKEGTNGKQGTCTLVAGTCTVSTTSITANSRVFLTAQSLGTVAVPSGYGVSARTAATSFTILASAPTDTSVIAYEIFEPAP